MVARSAIFLGLILAGCQDSEDVDLFEVVFSEPENGESDVVEALSPELGLSGQANGDTCGLDDLLLVPVNEDGSVAFELDYQLTFIDEGRKVVFNVNGNLVNGYSYSLGVHSDPEGCQDIDGRPLQPFGAEFYVP